MVLVGVKAREPEEEYGWIGVNADSSPSHRLPDLVHQVQRFIEKPSAHVARMLQTAGWYWNTMICTVSAGQRSRFFASATADLSRRFSRLEQKLRLAQSFKYPWQALEFDLQECYTGLKPCDFSSQLLVKVASRLLLLNMEDVDWDDRGRPRRILGSLNRIGCRPNFSQELAMASLPALQPPLNPIYHAYRVARS